MSPHAATKRKTTSFQWGARLRVVKGLRDDAMPFTGCPRLECIRDVSAGFRGSMNLVAVRPTDEAAPSLRSLLDFHNNRFALSLLADIRSPEIGIPWLICGFLVVECGRLIVANNTASSIWNFVALRILDKGDLTTSLMVLYRHYGNPLQSQVGKDITLCMTETETKLGESTTPFCCITIQSH